MKLNIYKEEQTLISYQKFPLTFDEADESGVFQK